MGFGVGVAAVELFVTDDDDGGAGGPAFVALEGGALTLSLVTVDDVTLDDTDGVGVGAVCFDCDDGLLTRGLKRSEVADFEDDKGAGVVADVGLIDGAFVDEMFDLPEVILSECAKEGVLVDDFSSDCFSVDDF